MSMARFVITAVVLEGRPKSAVARDYGVSRRWVQTLAARYLAEGEAAFEPRSRRPHRSPQRTSQAVEDAIVALRKDLTGAGHDAGAETIARHLRRQAGSSPSVATIWRILSRRGSVAPQPHKRPRSSWHRFEAGLPSELWQAGITHWPLVFTGIYRGRGWVALERELTALDTGLGHCRPCHPQTCGKAGRPHQTLKKWLARQEPAATLAGLQAQLDDFTACYNNERPHRAVGRKTPEAAWNARPRAIPARQGIRVSEHFRVRRDRVDADGKLTLRHNSNSRLHHIGTGRRWSGTKVLILARDLHIRIITQDNGELVRELTLDPTRNYQAQAPRGEL
jgi:transposase